jgi:prefoldin subunit 5
MAKAIINKHIDSVQDVVLTDLFIKDDKNKGELVICNDPENPTIYIMDTTGNPRKIAGGGGSGSVEAYDDTAIWNAVNKNTEAIADLKENPSSDVDEAVEALTKDIEGINGTIETITETVNGVTENLSTVSASIGEVPEGSTLVGMVSDVQGAIEENAQAIEDAKTTISNVESALTEEIETLKRVDSQNKEDLNTAITSVGTRLNSTIEAIGTVAEGATVVGMINDVQGATEANAQAIADNKTVIDEYTVNGKKISENPVLNTDDILVADNYSTLAKPADNVYPGDIITTAISKLEIMLANTTLALTAAINDLENRLQTLEDLYKESNTEPEA